MSRDCMFLGIVRYCVTIGSSFLTCNTKIYLPLVESLSGCLLFVLSTLAQSTLRWVTFSKCFESEILLIHTTFTEVFNHVRISEKSSVFYRPNARMQGISVQK